MELVLIPWGNGCGFLHAQVFSCPQFLSKCVALVSDLGFVISSLERAVLLHRVVVNVTQV